MSVNCNTTCHTFCFEPKTKPKNTNCKLVKPRKRKDEKPNQKAFRQTDKSERSLHTFFKQVMYLPWGYDFAMVGGTLLYLITSIVGYSFWAQCYKTFRIRNLRMFVIS
jgi:hypothetical protein